MAETKEQLVATIKEWIQTESEIKLLQKKLRCVAQEKRNYQKCWYQL